MRLARRAAEWAAVSIASVPLGLLYSIMLARGLGPEARGLYAVFTTFVSVIAGILALGLGVVARAQVAAQPEQARDVHGRLLAFVAVIAAFLMMSVYLGPVSRLPEPLSAYPLAIAACAAGAIYTGYGVLVLQGLGRFRSVNALRLAKAAIDLAMAGLLVVAFDLGVPGAIVGWTAAGLIGAGMTYGALARLGASPGRMTLKGIRSSLRHGWKILVASQAIALQVSLVILLLNKWAGSEKVGLFVIALGLSTQLAALCTTLAVVASDRIAGRDRGAAEELVKKLARITLSLAVPLVLMAASCALPIVKFLYGVPFAPAAPIFVILLAGTLISQITEVHAQYLIGQRWNSRAAMLLNVANLVGATVLAGLLIPRFGPLGAAASLSAAYITNAALHHLWVWRAMGCRHRELLLITSADVRDILVTLRLSSRAATS